MTTTTTTIYHTLERDNGDWWELAIPCNVGPREAPSRHCPGDPGEVEVLIDEMTIDKSSDGAPVPLSPTAEELAAIEKYCVANAAKRAQDEHDSDRADYLAGLHEDRRWGL